MLDFVGKLTSDGFWLGLLFLALFVGALSVLPAFLIGRNLVRQGEEFILMQQNVYKDEFFQYMPRAREVFDGHFPPTGVYSDEARPSPLNPLPPFLFSLFLRLFDGDVNGAYLAAQFFFTSIIFLLFFVLGLVIFRSKIYSVFFALVGVLTQIPQLLFRYYDRDYLSILFKKFVPIIRTPLDKMYFARMDDPMLTFPFLLAALIALYLFWIKPRFFTAVSAGLFSGLLAYVYLHYFLFVAMFIGVILLLAWRVKDCKINIKLGLILGMTFLLILIPYFLNYLYFNSFDSAHDYSLRLGKETSRFLVWEYLKSSANSTIVTNHFIYIALLLLVYFSCLRSRKNSYRQKGIFFLGLVLAMFLVWHTPFFFGFGFALMHFNKPINLAVFIILFDFIWLVFSWVRDKAFYFNKILAIGFITLAVSLLSKHIVNVTVFLQPPPDQLKNYDFPRELTSSWQWIGSNLENEPKIISDSLITSLYLSSYTPARPYAATGFISTLSNPELEKRFLVSNKLFSVSQEVLNLRLEEKLPYNCAREKCFKNTGINFGKSMWYLGSGAWPLNIYKNRDITLKEYENMKVSWSQTGADFVYYGPWEKQFSSVDLIKDTRLELVYKNASVEIFRMNNDIL